ncbi:MAG: PKD domain-containing protein [Candidatus Bipolaricaulia bacterium]
MRRHVVVGVLAVLMCTLLAGCMREPVPVATILIEPASGYSPLLVRLEADVALLEEPISYEWACGDGATAAGPTAEHEFVGKGPISVRLVVTDALGQQAVAEGVVQLLNRLPSARFTCLPSQPSTHLPIHFDASGSSDPDGEIVAYHWDFGDGSTDEGPSVVHAFETPDTTYRVVLTVTDDTGDENAMYRLIEPYGCDH